MPGVFIQMCVFIHAHTQVFSFKLKIPRSMGSVWNWLRNISSIFLLVVYTEHKCDLLCPVVNGTMKTDVTEGMRCLAQWPTNKKVNASLSASDQARRRAWEQADMQWRAWARTGIVDDEAEIDVHGLPFPVFVDLGGGSQEVRVMGSAGSGGEGGGGRGAREYKVGGARKLLAKGLKGDEDQALATSSEASEGRIYMGVAAVMLWVQMFQLSILSAPMAAFTYTVGIMLQDLAHSLFIILVLVASFGSALSILEDPPFDQGFDMTVVSLVQEVLGVGQPMYEEITEVSRTLLLIFVLSVTVVMLNVLIAQLTITYERVLSNMEAHALKYRASCCLDLESFIPMWIRRRLFVGLGFNTPLPFSPNDLGPEGGIQCLEPDDSEYYVPDRIIRFTGDASPKDPWPEEEAPRKKGEDDAHMGFRKP